MKAAVLGVGLIGSAIVEDLLSSTDWDVVAVDARADEGAKWSDSSRISIQKKDLSSSKSIKEAIAPADLVINALPGSLGYLSLKTAIEAGKNVVDIAFSPEDPFSLNDLAVKAGATAVVDCGFAPGLTNILVGEADAALDAIDTVEIYVGGLPRHPEPPFEYKAVFSPADVLEEYTRPARIRVDGKDVVKPALSEREELDFPQLGKLEAFLTDGLRTLLNFIDAPSMVEKTLRYPGHAEKIELLRDIGLFEKEEIELGNKKVSPLELTSTLLFKQWKYLPGEADCSVMRVAVKGQKGGKSYTHSYELFDEFDPEKGVSSMARTTGYTASAVLRMLASGMIAEKGIIAPETLGRDEAFVKKLAAELGERGLVWSKEVSGSAD